MRRWQHELPQVLDDAPMNSLFPSWSVEPLGDATGLAFGDEGVARRDAPEPDLTESPPARFGSHDPFLTNPRPASAATEPNSPSSAWEIGSRAAKQSPIFAAWMPVHMPLQWSTLHANVVHDAQPRQDLAVPLAAEGRGRQIVADGLQQVCIGHLRPRSTPALNHWRHVGARSGTNGIDRRTQESEHLANPLQSKALACTDGDRAADVDHLRPVKGRRACSSRSLRRIWFSPTRRAASLSRAFSGSPVRVFRLASMPAHTNAQARRSSHPLRGKRRRRVRRAATGGPRYVFRPVDQRLASAAPEALTL